MTIKFTNNATTTLASGINSSVTSLSVASGTGTLFPTLSGSDFFYALLVNLMVMILAYGDGPRDCQ